MENLQLSPLQNPTSSPFKAISIALLLMLVAVLMAYLVARFINRNLKRQIDGLKGENEILQEMIEAGKKEQEALKSPEKVESSPTQPAYRMPIINSGLKFKIQPEFRLAYPAFNAWNAAETLRVLAVFDKEGTFGEFRATEDAAASSAWVFQLFTSGGARLKENHLPIIGDQPDGKQIVTEIRTLLESESALSENL